MIKGVFEKGDIINILLDPSRGGEMQPNDENKVGRRFALVISTLEHNRGGLCTVALITNGKGHPAYPRAATSLAGHQTTGNVIANALMTIDPKARGAKFVEPADPAVVYDVDCKIVAFNNL